MSTSNFNLAQFQQTNMPSREELVGRRFAVVYAEWNSDITFALAEGARKGFADNGVCMENVEFYAVPGTFELTFAAAKLQKTGKFDAIIVIGCVIKGDTPHFDYICEGVTEGITALNKNAVCPVIFSVLTTLNKQQALDRCGGCMGNKGEEGAISALKMVKTFGHLK